MWVHKTYLNRVRQIKLLFPLFQLSVSCEKSFQTIDEFINVLDVKTL